MWATVCDSSRLIIFLLYVFIWGYFCSQQITRRQVNYNLFLFHVSLCLSDMKLKCISYILWRNIYCRQSFKIIFKIKIFWYRHFSTKFKWNSTTPILSMLYLPYFLKGSLRNLKKIIIWLIMKLLNMGQIFNSSNITK